MIVFSDTSPILSSPWRWVAPLVLAAAAVYLLLPRPRGRSVAAGGLLGVLALVLAGIFGIRLDEAVFPESFLFYSFSALALIGGVLTITQANPARAAISFALVVMNVSGLFLLQAAPFLMAAAIIVYAGAIIVTFLFVLMLAQQTGFSDADDRSREPFLAVVASFTLLGVLILLIDFVMAPARPFNELLNRAEIARTRESPQAIRESLGSPTMFLNDATREYRQAPNKELGERWTNAIVDLDPVLKDDRADTATLKEQLKKLVEVGHKIQEEKVLKPMPAENVSAIGRLLYSDYILAVELAGGLLLVATIGAIAISQRRERRGRRMIPLANYLVVGAILFVLGMIGFMTRRNLILMFLCAEMMLQGVTVNLVAFARAHGNLHGQVFTLFIITVAACEAALALALILMLYRVRRTLDVSVWQAIREPGQEETLDLDIPPESVREEALPHLTPSGAAPEGKREESYV